MTNPNLCVICKPGENKTLGGDYCFVCHNCVANIYDPTTHVVVPREPTEKFIDDWMDNESVKEPHRSNPGCREVVVMYYKWLIAAAEKE